MEQLVFSTRAFGGEEGGGKPEPSMISEVGSSE
jgi:hypothetical protein